MSNYKVLYRKYRPDNFENITGQEYIIKTLKNSIINNNISHAYIFSGPRGTGKTSTAKIFAKAINCLNPNNGSPCGKCEFCQNAVENPDIIEMDAASNNGVDEIREIIDNVKLTPTNGKYKVYIIDEVHMLTTSAFNALLLTLEEPPTHVVFILATTNIESVPITILSRCQRFDFQKIKVENIVEYLKNICLLEKIDAEESALEEIAYLSEGGMRDALSLLDQLSKNNEKITVDLIENEIKILSKSSLNELIEIIENNDVEKFLNQMEEYKKRGIDYKNFLKKMINALSLRAKNLKKISKYNRLDFSDYKKLVLELSESFGKININVEPYTILEMIFLEYFDIKRENQIRQNMIKEEPVAKTEQLFDDNLESVRINNCFVDAQKKYLELAKENYEKILTNVNINGKNKSILMDSNIVAASCNYLILTCETSHMVKSANENLSDFERQFKDILNVEYKMIFITKDKWNEVKNEYILNLKNGKKYQFIEEKNKDSQPIVSDIFDISKVEIV